MTGFIGTVAFVFLLIQSPSPVRHSFYEVFLHGHIVAAAVAVGGVWVHLDGMIHQRMMYGVVALWVMEVRSTPSSIRTYLTITARLAFLPPHQRQCW